MTNNLQINTAYSDLLSKVHYQSDGNGPWKVSPNIQYLFGNYLSPLPINKKCISFCLFCLLWNCIQKLTPSKFFFAKVIFLLSLSIVSSMWIFLFSHTFTNFHIPVFFCFKTYAHFHNLYRTLECKVKLLKLLIIAAFAHLDFTIEHILAAFTRLKFTITFITLIISALLMILSLKNVTAKNTVISPNFLV